MADSVTIHHPVTKGEMEVTKMAFETVWKDKGWTTVKSRGRNRGGSARSEDTQGNEPTPDPSEED